MTGDTAFDVTLSFSGQKERLTVPYVSVVAAEVVVKPANEATAPAIHGPGAATVEEDKRPPTESDANAVMQRHPLMRGFALACLIAGVLNVAAFLIVAGLFSPPAGATLWDVVFFASLPPDMLAQTAKGHVNFWTYASQPLFVGAIALIYGVVLLLSAASIAIPFRSKRPFSLQVSFVGFLWGMLVTLFLYRQFHLTHELMFAILRVAWITLIYWTAERAKAAFPENWIGAEYFPSLVDGLFGIISALIVQSELKKNFSDVTSGPVFLIVSFFVIICVARTYRRRLLRRALLRIEIDVPDETDPTPKSAVRAVGSSYLSLVQKLNAMTTEQMEARYAELKTEITRGPLPNLPGGPGLTAAVTLLLTLWSLALAFAWWGALNLNLYYPG